MGEGVGVEGRGISFCIIPTNKYGGLGGQVKSAVYNHHSKDGLGQKSSRLGRKYEEE